MVVVCILGLLVELDDGILIFCDILVWMLCDVELVFVLVDSCGIFLDVGCILCDYIVC